MTTNKRTASSILNEDIETKKLKTDIASTSSTSTTIKESITSSVDENNTKKISEFYSIKCIKLYIPE